MLLKKWKRDGATIYETIEIARPSSVLSSSLRTEVVNEWYATVQSDNRRLGDKGRATIARLMQGAPQMLLALKELDRLLEFDREMTSEEALVFFNEHLVEVNTAWRAAADAIAFVVD